MLGIDRIIGRNFSVRMGDLLLLSLLVQKHVWAPHQGLGVHQRLGRSHSRRIGLLLLL